jgi:hypothetical protein
MKELYQVTEDTFPPNFPEAEKCFLIADYMIMDSLNNQEKDLIIKTADPFYKTVQKCYTLHIVGEFANNDAAKLSVSPTVDLIT